MVEIVNSRIFHDDFDNQIAAQYKAIYSRLTESITYLCLLNDVCGPGFKSPLYRLALSCLQYTADCCYILVN
jgi:hypothetical protein